ncbi:MAG: alpha/beta hydrolase [Hyphomicrobiales bacterium]|nr:alpha/beta hydrolase [Hyphomicrobiales bacterium]
MQGLAKEGFLSIDGMQLEFHLYGETPNRSPTIVMVHEGIGSVRTWGDFPRLLSDATGASVLVYSREGHGSSPLTRTELPLEYIREHALKVLPRILDEIGFKDGLLLGHSDGASMAAAYAGTFNDPRVRGLVLMAPHFCVEEETLAEIRNARVAFECGDLRLRLSRYHANVDAAFRRWNDVWLDPQFAAFNLNAELANISVPTFVIRGDKDKYGTHRQVHVAEQLHRGELKTLLMQNCGHVPHREDAAQTVEVIAAFCKPLLRPQAPR